jgi:hypothetical protein
VYRGKAKTEWQGNYFFGDWSGKMFYMKQNTDGKWMFGHVIAGGNRSNDTGMNINSMGADEDGEIYLVTQKSFGPKSNSGAVYRITD